MKEDCTTCIFATKKPGGKVSCSEFPEKGKAFKPIDDCGNYTPMASQELAPIPYNSGEYDDNPKTAESTNSFTKSIPTILTSRTPALIAAEINEIKHRTKNMVLYNSIDIGRKLVEAKSLLNHGEWGEWLETSVNYSHSTANNLMRIFDEYGAEQITLLTDNAKSQTFANLSYSQAIALFGIPESEREQFIDENDVLNMSARELQQAIKDRDQAQAEKEQAEKDKENVLAELNKIKLEAQTTDDKINSLISEKDKLKNELDTASNKVDEDTIKKLKELEKAKKDLEKKQNEIDKMTSRIKELETKSLEVKPGATPEDIDKIKSDTAATYEKDLAVIRSEKEQAEKRAKDLEIKITQQNNAGALSYKVYFEALTKDFTEILKALSDIKESDIDTYERYKKATAGLINMMSERL